MADPGTGYVVAFGVGTTLASSIALRLWQHVALRRARAAGAKENTARRLVGVGQLVAVFLVAASSVKNALRGEALGEDLLWVAAFTAAGLALLLVSGEIGVRILLRSRLQAEIERGNTAAGVAAGAHYLATGVITAHAVAGDDLHSLGLSLAFFGIAQATLHLFVVLFRTLTVYDDAEQIQGENLAAALSYAGITIAISVIVASAVDGDTFDGWVPALQDYGTNLLFVLALYPVRQLLVQWLLLGARPTLRGGRLDQAIAVERDHGMAALEAGTYLATALAVTRML